MAALDSAWTAGALTAHALAARLDDLGRDKSALSRHLNSSSAVTRRCALAPAQRLALSCRIRSRHEARNPGLRFGSSQKLSARASPTLSDKII
jgi:hypothetical protein